MSAVILMRFDESGRLQPSDALGNLDDMGTESASFVAAATPSYSRPDAVSIVTVSTPVATRPSDTMLWFVWSNFDSAGEVDTSTIPAGWSVLSHLVDGAQRISLLRRTAIDNEPTQHTLRLAGGVFCESVLLVYRGLDNAAAIVDAATNQFTALSLFTCPSLTLATASDIYVGFIACSGSTTALSLPAGVVERYSQTQTPFGAAAFLEAIELHTATAGPTGTQAIGIGDFRSGVAVAYAFRSAPALTAPSRISAWTGFGRRFLQAQSNVLVAPDKSGNGTLLQRDTTIQVLISLTLAGASGPQTIIARGLNDGSATERYAYGLEVQEQAGFPGFVEVRWFWQDETGAIRTQAPGVFRSPGDGVEFMLTATRRWESTSRVVVRYYVGDELIAELVSADGSIAGGTTGRTTIGARKAAGSYGRFFNGVIDELLVTDNEMSLEEIRHTWRRLTEYQPGGAETFAALAPRGSVWARNPGNDIGKRVKIVGQLLGLGVAGAEELRALLLPDAAPLPIVERWEAICELSATPGDSLDVRRARIVSYLSRDEGFQLAPIAQALSGPMALDPDLVEILEFTNTITDEFSGGISAERWFDGGAATWSTVAGELRAAAPAGVDLRWESRATPFLLTSAEPGRLFVSAKLSSFNSMAIGVFMGLALHNRATNDWLWFGMLNNAGTNQLVYRTALAGGSPSAPIVLVAAAPAGPHWLRIATPQRAGFVDNGALTLSFSTTGPSTGFTDVNINSGLVTGWLWAGFALSSTVAITGSATAVAFDDFVLHCADGLRPYLWYAFRDPALAGSPDMLGADRLVKKIKPAYTYAAAISSRRVICDDPRDGICDLGPVG